jgi:hypothetical protein
MSYRQGLFRLSNEQFGIDTIPSALRLDALHSLPKQRSLAGRKVAFTKRGLLVPVIPIWLKTEISESEDYQSDGPGNPDSNP